MTNLAALIFDVDGTLAETEALHRQAFNDAFAAAGLDWSWDPSLYRILLDTTGGRERIVEYQRRAGLPPLGPAQLAALHADKTARYAALMRSGALAPRTGIRRLLHEAHEAGLRLAIATTSTPTAVQALLAAAGTLPPFDVIAAGDAVPEKKPAPDVYRLALAGLALPPEACIAIEDSQAGLASATGAGLRCVITRSAHGARHGGQGPHPAAAAVLTSLGDPDHPARSLAGPSLPSGIADLAWFRALPP